MRFGGAGVLRPAPAPSSLRAGVGLISVWTQILMNDCMPMQKKKLRPIFVPCAMQGLCSDSGWAPPATTKVGGYACTLHGRPIGLDTKVLVSGCARKLGRVLTRGGQVHRLIDEVLQHSANRGGGALVYADGPGVDDTYDK